MVTEPQHGWTVDCEEVIKGTYSSDIQEDPIWLVVEYDKKFWPWEEAAKAPPLWSGTVYFGECDKPEEWREKTFGLIIVTTNEQANTEFQDFRAAAQAVQSAGMDRLPEGAKVYRRIIVTRR